MPAWNGIKAVTLVAALLASSITVAHADTTFDDVKEQTQALLAVIGDYSHDRRDALVTVSKTTLAGIDANIDDMNANIRDKWKDMSDTAKVDAQAALDDLRRRRLDAAEKLGALEHSSAAGWADVRNGFVTAMADLDAALDQAQQEF